MLSFKKKLFVLWKWPLVLAFIEFDKMKFLAASS